MDRLTQARPTDDDLRDTWPPEERAALLAGVRARALTDVRRRPHRRAMWLVAASVTAIAVVPTVLEGGDAHARNDIRQLAAAAADTDGLTFGPGTYLHVKTESVQENSRIFGDGRTLDTNREVWVRWDGAQWAVDTRPSAGWTEYHYFAPSSDIGFSSPTPQFVAHLPDAPAELREYLDTNVSGSNSHDEALFFAVTDLANSHLLDPATLAVALEAIADVDGVKTEDVEVEGREAVEISYRRFHFNLLGVDSVTIDKETAQVLRVSSSSPGGTYTSTTTLAESVDRIPAPVLAAYDKYGNGTRVCSDGREATGDGEC
jgi:hypothetical protein